MYIKQRCGLFNAAQILALEYGRLNGVCTLPYKSTNNAVMATIVPPYDGLTFGSE